MPNEPSVVGSHSHSCPSARCEEGATLLGIVGDEGVVGYITPEFKIDAEFCRRALEQGRPEKRFRFAQPCIEGRCAQWSGSRCGLIELVLHSAARSGIAETAETNVPALPPCVIRSSCRWFAQEGAQACLVCPSVVHTPE
jgi:hypothetical protein